MLASGEAPVLVVGRRGQVASALQRLAPALLPRPLVVLGRPELDLAPAGPVFAQHWVDLLARHQPALVINAAAYTAVDRAETELELAMAVNGHAVGAHVLGLRPAGDSISRSLHRLRVCGQRRRAVAAGRSHRAPGGLWSQQAAGGAAAAPGQ